MTSTAVKTIAITDLAATAVVFSTGRDGYTYVVEAERSETLDFWKVYGHDAKRVEAYGLDDYGKRFFAFYVADCFDPPVAIIRSDSFEDAYETFCDEFSQWMAISDEDLKDYDEETMNYSASGVAIDTEAVQGHEVQLLRVIVATSAGAK